DVHLSRRLKANIGVDVLGDALVNQLNITSLADALPDAVHFTGDADINALVTVDLVFGVDAGGFFIQVDPNQPEFVVSDVKIDSGDAQGDFGFLNVEIHDPSLVMEDGVELRFDLHDPGTQGADGKIRPLELATAPFDDLVSFQLVSPNTPNVPDITLTANMEVHTELAGLEIPLGEVPLTVKWDGMADDSLHVDVAGADANSYLAFLKLRPDQLLAKVQDLKAQLAQLSTTVSVDIPFVNLSFSNLIKLDTTFDQRILSNLRFEPGIPGFTDAQSLVSSLSSSLTDLIPTAELDPSQP